MFAQMLAGKDALDAFLDREFANWRTAFHLTQSSYSKLLFVGVSSPFHIFCVFAFLNPFQRLIEDSRDHSLQSRLLCNAASHDPIHSF